MHLNFLGTDPGFGTNHTSAYFCPKQNEMVIIDLPASTFQKLKKGNIEKLENFEKISVLITHTHGDHVGGLGLFIQYAYFVLENPITVIAPSSDVGKDIVTLLNIEGVADDWYHLICADQNVNEAWFIRSIATKHSPQLEGKCFGYQLNIEGNNIVYTGDTSTLEPFYPYLDRAYLYVDTSVHYGAIHLKLSDMFEPDSMIRLLNANIKKIYLMHLDDPGAARYLTEKHRIFKIVEPVDN